MFVKTAVWNIQKFHPTYQSGGPGKTDSRNKGFAKSVGKIFRFPSFNPVFKSTKIRYLFGTIMNAPDNWTKIGYTFGPWNIDLTRGLENWKSSHRL